MSKQLILGLFTELLGPGGIQRISRHTAVVLSLVARECNYEYQILSLNDSAGNHVLDVGGYVCEIQGFGRRKTWFSVAALVAMCKARLAFLGHPNLSPLGLVGRFLNPKLRFWIATYGIEVWGPLSRMRRLGLRSAYGVTALSKFTADQVAQKQGVNPVRIALIPPALDPDFLKKGGSSNSPSRLPGKILLTVTRLATTEQLKGVDTVIQAMPKILQDIPDAYYYIVGDGDDRTRLEKLAAELGVRSHVRFVGKKGENELRAYYQQADVFVMPSRKEGFGIVFLEAMAFGKPVVGGNHGGTPDVVVDGKTGFLVQHGDIDSLVERLIRLLQNDDLRQRMGEAARERVMENYTFEHFQQRLKQLLIGGKQCAS